MVILKPFPVKFPQISRIFPSSISLKLAKGILWLNILLFFILNLFNEIMPVDDIVANRRSLLKKPFQPAYHAMMAESLTFSNMEQSRLEMILAQDYSGYKFEINQLGLQDVDRSLLSNTGEDIIHEKEINYWRAIAEDFEGYDFAYAKLSSLYFFSGNHELAEKYRNLIPIEKSKKLEK
ncbi:MAG: hypothetical protein UV73_C0004G0039 [Candidatus Gottesmanbacteria bacterium GW2011_GWA2_43_14]|uniref:Uncharacterized protein n=1 Tax=Candidatus Gottesmanbacteria bacterium GW2011_GWA2_43_14 TaxID=1618443 RepID=A0A0G1DJY8_9BACT|nr:MAG: hypothetical protein UV73_C0004G0039 [Candidatus Gottesmanbacteria bacterium GW2011_GWA2_43_14]